MEVKCQKCGRLFIATNAQIQKGFGKFCSRQCRKDGENRTCQTCGKSFYVPAHIVALGKGKYCSRECKPKAALMTCQTCGKEFRVSHHVVAKGGGKYCSKSCNKRKMTSCKTCGKEFYCPPSRKRNGWGIFCSRSCYGKFLSALSLEERFWETMRDVPRYDSQCWEWAGSFVSKGYGKITKEGKSYGAHRISYTIFHGPIPDGLQVLHKCDNPPCVNPEHLFMGTAMDNTRDMMLKDRHKGPIRKLLVRDVIAIKLLIAQGVPYKKISASYGISRCHVSEIKHGKVWKHVTLPLSPISPDSNPTATLPPHTSSASPQGSH